MASVWRVSVTGPGQGAIEALVGPSSQVAPRPLSLGGVDT